MKTIIVATLVVGLAATATANTTRTTLEGAVLQTVPKGYSVLFVKGIDVDQKAEVSRGGTWQQRISTIASLANAIAEIDETANTVRISAARQHVPAIAKPQLPQPSTQSTVVEFELQAQPGELLSSALRKSLQRYGHTLVWSLKTDLEITVAYTQSKPTINELYNAVMRDYQLSGTLFVKNRVLVVTDPAIKE